MLPQSFLHAACVSIPFGGLGNLVRTPLRMLNSKEMHKAAMKLEEGEFRRFKINRLRHGTVDILYHERLDPR